MASTPKKKTPAAKKPAKKRKPAASRAKKAPEFTPATLHKVVNPAHIDAEKARGLAPAHRRR